MTRYSRMTGRRLPEPTVRAIHPPVEIRDNTKARREWLAVELEKLVAAGEDARVTGTGSYQQISVKIKREKATKVQLRGFCQCCGGRWAVTQGKVSHHGYTRPGNGWQTPSCIGAREVPLSESCEVTKAARTSILLQAERLRAAAEGKFTEIPVEVREHGYYVTTRTEFATPETAKKYVQSYSYGFAGQPATAWDYLVERHRQNLRQQAEGAQEYAEHLGTLIERFERGEFVGTTTEETVEA